MIIAFVTLALIGLAIVLTNWGIIRQDSRTTILEQRVNELEKRDDNQPQR